MQVAGCGLQVAGCRLDEVTNPVSFLAFREPDLSMVGFLIHSIEQPGMLKTDIHSSKKNMAKKIDKTEA